MLCQNDTTTGRVTLFTMIFFMSVMSYNTLNHSSLKEARFSSENPSHCKYHTAKQDGPRCYLKDSKTVT